MTKEALKILVVIYLCGYVTGKREDLCPTMADIPEGEGRDVTIEVFSTDCNRPLTGLSLLCINGKGTVGAIETSPGVYQFTASKKNQLIKLAKDGYKTQPLRIPRGDTDLTLTTSLNCSTDETCSTESYRLRVQLTACEGETATPVLSTPEGLPVESINDGEYQLQLCPLPAVINADVNGYETQVTMNSDNEQVILSCNGCHPLKLFVSSCESGSLISGATANKALIELETGVYLVDICAEDTQLTVTGPDGNQAVVTIPDPIPDSVDVILECPESEDSTFARYFVFTVLSTYEHSTEIHITAKTTTNVTISSPAFTLQGDQPFLVQSDNIFKKTVPKWDNLRAYDSNAYSQKRIHEAGIEISADSPVSVSVMKIKTNISVNEASGDETVIIPEKYLGTEYITYIPTSEESNPNRVGTFSVTAIEDGTIVQISFKSGETEIITLNKLYVYRRKGDNLSEAFISASAPVHVQVGHVCAKLFSVVNDPNRPCSVLITDLLPIASLKKVYILPTLIPNYMSLAITAPFDQTEVKIFTKDGDSWTQDSVMDGRTSQLFNVEYESNIRTIVASKPIQVIQFGREPFSTSLQGAPSMTIVPAVEQYTNFYKFPNTIHMFGIVYTILEQSKASGLHVESTNQNALPMANEMVIIPEIGIYTIQFTMVWSPTLTSIYHDDPEVNFGAIFYAYDINEATATFLGLKP